MAREKELARADSLTGVSNHGHLFRVARHLFEVAKRYRQPLSLIMFDLDNFKQINDIFGHAVGDLALQTLTQVVQSELRASDVIGRYGGDEFTILLPLTIAQDALALAARIHTSIANVGLKTEKGCLPLTISIGIAQTNPSENNEEDAPDTVENLFLRADKALYHAKQAGKKRSAVYGEPPTSTDMTFMAIS